MNPAFESHAQAYTRPVPWLLCRGMSLVAFSGRQEALQRGTSLMVAARAPGLVMWLTALEGQPYFAR